jgi:hypothetical protein
MAQNTVTLLLSGYDSVDYAYKSASNLNYPVGKTVDEASDRGYFSPIVEAYKESYVYYTFDTSVIPDNAAIVSVSCTVKMSCAKKNFGKAQLCSGTMPKGEYAYSSNGTTTAALDGGDWSRSELANCRLKMSGQYGATTTNIGGNIYLHAAELTVVYAEKRDPIPIAEMSTGDIVRLNVDGENKKFIVVHQGLPSSVYDSSCDGTWLLMEKCFNTMAFDSTDNDYANSDIHSYLNNTFFDLFDSNTQSVIKPVKLPYTNGAGTSGSVASGANGLSAQVFLLSRAEVIGGTVSYNNTEGATLSYFDGVENSERVAYYGTATKNWWLRSPFTTTDESAGCVMTSGSVTNLSVLNIYGVRPALVIDSSVLVDDTGTVNLSSLAIRGSVIIDGSRKEITEGYVNIGGVWKPVVESYVNIGGVWKPSHE